ncbi:MAG TPA: IS630 family transposase [Candidatus Saccharimonadia bacterium]|nr:IS630 family transposase [Candidatus Saccharimonadia bacterium]
MRKTNITNEEKILLKEYAKTSPLILIRYKAGAVLMANKGMSSADIGDIQDRSSRTVGSWLNAWRTSRLSMIFTGHAGNDNASPLTRDQRQEVKQALSSPPSDFGLPQAFWDVPQLKTYLQTKFEIVYESPQSYHFLLRFSNLSFKYPDTFDLRRNVATIEARMREIHAEVAPLLTSKEWEVFAVDEVRIEQEAITRRAWLKKGKRTIVKVDRDKEAQSYIGFLNQKSFTCEVYEMPWQNQEEVLKAFELFLKNHPDKKIAIIWDNAAFHKGRAIRTALAKGQLLERVHLIPMPPYAPDNNPIEHVWNTTKQAVANIQRSTFEDTKKAFTGYIAGRLFKYGL